MTQYLAWQQSGKNSDVFWAPCHIYLQKHLWVLLLTSFSISVRNLGLQSSKVLNPEAYLLGTTLPLCQQISGLSNGQQKLCMLYTDHMMHVGRGARRGIAECKFQFNERKWNCSTVEDSTVFGPILSIRKCMCWGRVMAIVTWCGAL